MSKDEEKQFTTFSFVMGKDEGIAFKNLCDAEDKSFSKVLRHLIADYMEVYVGKV